MSNEGYPKNKRNAEVGLEFGGDGFGVGLLAIGHFGVAEGFEALKNGVFGRIVGEYEVQITGGRVGYNIFGAFFFEVLLYGKGTVAAGHTINFAGYCIAHDGKITEQKGVI